MQVIKEANSKINADDDGYDHESESNLSGAEQSINTALANINYHAEEG
jgi:hypothetical protein